MQPEEQLIFTFGKGVPKEIRVILNQYNNAYNKQQKESSEQKISEPVGQENKLITKEKIDQVNTIALFQEQEEAKANEVMQQEIKEKVLGKNGAENDLGDNDDGIEAARLKYEEEAEAARVQEQQIKEQILAKIKGASTLTGVVEILETACGNKENLSDSIMRDLSYEVFNNFSDKLKALKTELKESQNYECLNNLQEVETKKTLANHCTEICDFLKDFLDVIRGDLATSHSSVAILLRDKKDILNQFAQIIDELPLQANALSTYAEFRTALKEDLWLGFGKGNEEGKKIKEILLSYLKKDSRSGVSYIRHTTQTMMMKCIKNENESFTLKKVLSAVEALDKFIDLKDDALVVVKQETNSSQDMLHDNEDELHNNEVFNEENSDEQDLELSVNDYHEDSMAVHGNNIINNVQTVADNNAAEELVVIVEGSIKASASSDQEPTVFNDTFIENVQHEHEITQKQEELIPTEKSPITMKGLEKALEATEAFKELFEAFNKAKEKAFKEEFVFYSDSCYNEKTKEVFSLTDTLTKARQLKKPLDQNAALVHYLMIRFNKDVESVQEQLKCTDEITSNEWKDFLDKITAVITKEGKGGLEKAILAEGETAFDILAKFIDGLEQALDPKDGKGNQLFCDFLQSGDFLTQCENLKKLCGIDVNVFSDSVRAEEDDDDCGWDDEEWDDEEDELPLSNKERLLEGVEAKETDSGNDNTDHALNDTNALLSEDGQKFTLQISIIREQLKNTKYYVIYELLLEIGCVLANENSNGLVLWLLGNLVSQIGQISKELLKYDREGASVREWQGIQNLLHGKNILIDKLKEHQALSKVKEKLENAVSSLSKEIKTVIDEIKDTSTNDSNINSNHNHFCNRFTNRFSMFGKTETSSCNDSTLPHAPMIMAC